MRGGEDRSMTAEKQTRNSVFKSTNKTLYKNLSKFFHRFDAESDGTPCGEGLDIFIPPHYDLK